MRVLIKTGAILFLNYLFFSQLFAQNNDSIDKFLNRYKTDNGPGYAIYVIKNQKVIAEKFHGFADIEQKEKINKSTPFYLYDITNQFTAASILLLSQQDELSLDDLIIKHLPFLPLAYEKVKVGNLLNHTSGLPFYNFKKHKDEVLTNQDIIDYVAEKDTLMFQPGTKVRYNPLNYVLLAEIIEEKGKRYDRFLKKYFFRPLNMKETEAYIGRRLKVKDYAKGYLLSNNNWLLQEPWKYKEYYGNTGVFASIDDLKKWIISLENKTILKKKYVSAMFRLNYSKNAKYYYAYGWTSHWRKNKIEYYKPGAGSGYTNLVYTYPHLNITIIILTNQTDVFKLKKVAEEITDFMERSSK